MFFKKKKRKLFKFIIYTIIPLILSLFFLITILNVLASAAGDDLKSKPTFSGARVYPDAVELYRGYAENYCEIYGIPDYIDLVLSIMSVCSGGEGDDLMNTYNTSYWPEGVYPDSITSIEIGVKILAECLIANGVTDPNDVESITNTLHCYNGKTGSQHNNEDFTTYVLAYYLPSTGSGVLAWPVPGFHNIYSDYGARNYGDGWHSGIDISEGGIFDALIVAADGGTVIVSKQSNSGLGFHIKIDHGNGMITVYGHCNKLLVSENSIVSSGDPIAQVGDTGDSKGAHLHFEVYVDGVEQNPNDYVSP